MMQKIAICAPSHNFVGPYLPTKACFDNRKKLVKQQYLPHMSLQYGELRPTRGWDRFVSLGHPSKFQRVSHLASVTARHSAVLVDVSQTAALNRGRRLYSAGRPSRWALAHISSLCLLWPPCGFFLSSIFFFTAPNLSGHRLDVYHTSTYGVALVQI